MDAQRYGPGVSLSAGQEIEDDGGRDAFLCFALFNDGERGHIPVMKLY